MAAWPQLVVGQIENPDGGITVEGAEIWMVLPDGRKIKSTGFCHCYSGMSEVKSCSGAFQPGPEINRVSLQVTSMQGELLAEKHVSLPGGEHCGKNTTYVGVSVGSAGTVQFDEPVRFNACK